MADYIIDINSLQSKKGELDSLTSNINTIYSNFESSFSKFKSGEISGMVDKINTPMTRYKEAYTKCGTWLNNYLSEVNSLESSLASFSGKISSPTEFKGKFVDMFGKVTMPVLKTGGDKEANYKTFGGGEAAALLEQISASGYLNPANLSGKQLNFINSIVDGAINAYNKYGVLPSLTLAQAILESGWGKSPIGHNLFGIKAGSSWKGKTKTVGTKEQKKNGQYIKIRATFRDYDSYAESVEDHAKLLTNSRYKRVLASKNYKEACKAVKDCGYATSLSYTKNLINIIEKYGLNQWDPKKT